MDLKKIKLFAGSGCKEVAQNIADILGLPLSSATVSRFSDGEAQVSIEESVRGKNVFIIQSTCEPVNDNLMELLVMVDALRRASAGRITAVIPYFGYARQDRRAKPRDPISAKLVSRLIEVAGVDQVLTMDLHANQIQGFFEIPVDNLMGTSVLTPHFVKMVDGHTDEWIVVSPDHGSVNRCRAFAEKLGLPLAIIDKRRQKANSSEVMNIIGDVKGKKVILCDDMVDTAGTLCNGAKALVEIGGAKYVVACATHGVLSGPAIQRLTDSVIDKLLLLDTIPLAPSKKCAKIEMLSVAPILADAIKRIVEDDSVSELIK